MTQFRKIRVILGTTFLILVLPGTVYVVITARVPEWLVVLQLIAAVAFLIGAMFVLAVDATMRGKRRR